MMFLLLSCVSACLVPTYALYSSSDDVIELTQSNFQSQVINSEDLWLVEFYAPWCGHCKNLAPEWKKAATALKGVVKVAAVDMDTHQQVGQPYNVKGFPTIKMFGINKQSPQDYNGGRNADSIVNEALSHVQSMVRARLQGGSGGSRDDSGSRGGSGGAGSADDVVELTDSNFEAKVLASDEPWLVEFFAPWCGHCQSLKPHWESAASQLKGKIRLGALDSTVHTVTSGKYEVKGFPTIKFFPGGKKSGEAEEYDGGRTADDIVRWAGEKVVASLPPPELLELTSEDVLIAACNQSQLCFVSVLPHILDCQADCRNAYLAIVRSAAEKFKNHAWQYVWTEAAQQTEVEDAFGMGGFGYPGMVAVNSRKMKYASLRGPFSDKGIHEFLRDLSMGRGSTAPVKNSKLPAVKTAEPWDGKDGKPIEEEEIDLKDLGIDVKNEL